MLTLKEHWQAFSKLVIPDSASEAQRLCMRDAFYAGLSTMFDAMTSDYMEELPEDEAMAVLVALHQELYAFKMEALDRATEKLAAYQPQKTKH